MATSSFAVVVSRRRVRETGTGFFGGAPEDPGDAATRACGGGVAFRGSDGPEGGGVAEGDGAGARADGDGRAAGGGLAAGGLEGTGVG
jgi:hypothetical protein